MYRNKPRFYLAVYESEDPAEQYHSALLVCPKAHRLLSDARRTTKHEFVAGAEGKPWNYRCTGLCEQSKESTPLALLRLGKLRLSLERIDQILKNAPHEIKHGSHYAVGQTKSEAWVESAIVALRAAGGFSPPVPSWIDAKKDIKEFLEEEETAGRWSSGWKGETGVPIRYSGSGLTVFKEWKTFTR